MPRQFACPHCGATIDADEYAAGQSCRCTHCGKTTVVPLVGGVVPRRESRAADQGRSPCNLALVYFVLMALIIAFLIRGIFYNRPLSRSRESGRYATCVNNLRQIASAMQRYHEAHGCFPPAFIPDETGKPMHSWRVLILPFLDREDLFASYRLDEPWNSLNNMALARRMPPFYRCPSNSSADPSLTSYAMIVGSHAISDGSTARRISDIMDGTANTIIVAENVNAEIMWLEPRDLNTKDMALRVNAFRDSPREAGTAVSSRHPGCANVLFCDGTVRLIAETMDEKTLKALLTIDGGEAIAARDLDP